MDSRQSWVDSLKGIGLCGVILTHVGGADIPLLLEKIIAAGKYGVQLLFLISGYLTISSYRRYFGGNVENTLKNNAKWIVKRIWRLIPMYVLALLVYVSADIICGGLISNFPITAGNVITHILFAHGLFPHYINGIIPGGWYLGTLVLLYLLIPLIDRICDSIEKTVALWVVTSIFGCFISNILINLTSNMSDAGIYSDYFGRFWIVTQLPVFMTGVLAYNLLSTEIADKILYKKTFAFALLLTASCLLAGLILEQNRIKGISDITLYAVAFFLVFISQYISPFILLDNTVFRYIGRHSYPIYLFHAIVIWILNVVVKTLDVRGTVWMVVRFATVLGLSCALAAIINKRTFIK